MTFSKNGLCIWRYWNVKVKHEDSFEETVEKTRFYYKMPLQDSLFLMYHYVPFIRWCRFERYYSYCGERIREIRKRTITRIQLITKIMTNTLKRMRFSQIQMLRLLI